MADKNIELDIVVGQKLKNLRDIHGFTQAYVAERLGYANPNAISQIENGLKGMGKHRMLKAAKLYNIDPNDLFSPEAYTREELEMKVALERIIKGGAESREYQLAKLFFSKLHG